MPYYLFRDCNQGSYDGVFETQSDMDECLRPTLRYVAEPPHPFLPVYTLEQPMEKEKLYTTNWMGNTDCCRTYVLYTERELDLKVIMDQLFYWKIEDQQFF